MQAPDTVDEVANDVYGLAKPRFRGAVHAYSIAPFMLAGIALIVLADRTTERVASTVYVLAIIAMLTASATYHRARVSAKTRSVLRKVDHSMIGVAVAGTYTPVVALVADGTTRAVLLALLWGGALGAMALTIAWPEGPRLLRAAIYIALGWAGVWVVPELVREVGWPVLVFVLFGGALYSAGAIVYARRKPDPSPRIFGFHEVFHSFVTAAVAMHFVAVALVVL